MKYINHNEKFSIKQLFGKEHRVRHIKIIREVPLEFEIYWCQKCGYYYKKNKPVAYKKLTN